MSTAADAPGSALKTQATPRINDMVISIATANGSGSQSANQILTRSIFQMGIPVGAKNLFPSNIQGLPTWYNIRASKDGWLGRRADADVMIAMNPESVVDDIAELMPGSVLIIRDDMEGFVTRDDLRVIVVPFNKMVAEVCEIARLRRLVINMLYVGIAGHLLGIEGAEIDRAVTRVFQSKPKAADVNRAAIAAATKWAQENLQAFDHIRLERMDKTAGKIIIDGNEAAALGAVWGGVTVAAWYPITPSSSLTESMIDHLSTTRHDPETGKATYAVIQAEDELAAMAMITGAGWAGARSMTSTSGPGISLMAELAGLCYFAEIPVVIFDVQRMGPSTGLPTRTNQGDISKAYYLSHGDCKHLLLIPGNVAECFEFGCEAFNYSERFQTLVFVMSDLDLGMNMWMSDPFAMPTKPISRGKVLSAEDLEKLEGKWGRYRDVDGDGIPYRTLPGTEHAAAAYFTRGTGHTPEATYSEKAYFWQLNMDRLAAKFETARKELPEPILHENAKAEFGVIAYGSSDFAVQEALANLRDEHGVELAYLRVRALPAHQAVYDFITKYPKVFLIEQNRDAQMAGILRAERPELAAKIHCILHYNGAALDADSVSDPILTALNVNQGAQL